MSNSSSALISFDTETYIHVLLLRIIGVTAFKNRTLDFPTTRLLTFLFHLSYCFFTAMYLYTFVRNYIDAQHNIEQITETIILLGCHTRFLLLHSQRAEVATMLKLAERMWLSLETKERKTVAKFLDKSKTVVYAYLGACFVMCSFYIVVSQIFGFTANVNLNTTRSLPFDFFVNVQNTPWFEVVLALQTVTMFGLAITTNGIDTSGPFFIMMACGYLRTLSYRIQSISKTNEIKEYESKDFVKAVLSCIKYHQMIFNYCYQIQMVMGGIFMTQLITSTYNMALLGLKAVGDDPDKSKYAALIIVLLLQLLFLQWAPDMLIDESKAVANNCFFVPSFGYENRNFSKLIYIFIMRSQRPIELRAAGYVKLSMESFGSMITDIMSFFTVLHSFN